uniref:Putative secreted protein n=1 Tax=Anopheles darlingi TaxID=43151 RepID=A0A2M4D8F6_ANODA
MLNVAVIFCITLGPFLSRTAKTFNCQELLDRTFPIAIMHQCIESHTLSATLGYPSALRYNTNQCHRIPSCH